MNTYDNINGIKKFVVEGVKPNENEQSHMQRVVERVVSNDNGPAPMRRIVERVEPNENEQASMSAFSSEVNRNDYNDCDEPSMLDAINDFPDDYANHTFPCNNSSNYIRYAPYIPTLPFFREGISQSQAQRLNEQIIQGRIAVDNLHALNVERFSYKKALEELKIQQGRETGMITTETGAIIPFPKNPTINLREFEQDYIIKHAIVKLGSRCTSKYSIMVRSVDEHRHITIEDNDLKINYFDEMELLPNSDILPQTAKENSFRRMKSLIPKLQNAKLHILNEYEVMFTDGYLNLKTMDFTPVEGTQQNEYFNVFSVDIQYSDGTCDNPRVFDAFLRLILDNAEPARKGVYQMIGSILAPAPSFKKCYLLQGMSNSGKTTLVNHIMRLISDEDIMELSNISQLTDSSLTNPKTPLRLIHIRELGSDKLASKQIVSIKSFVDGSSSSLGSSSFKIIMTTNNKITTGKDGLIENGLKNRLLVIPFPKAIDFDDADPDVQALGDVFFEKERRSIIITALKEYSEVLRNSGKFSCDYEVNTVVEPTEENCQGLTDEERASIPDAINENQTNSQPVLAEIFDRCFVIADRVNPDMTAEVVMNTVNSVRKGLLITPASTGRELSAHFGDRLCSGRPNGKTAYNLEFSSPQSSSEN